MIMCILDVFVLRRAGATVSADHERLLMTMPSFAMLTSALATDDI
jgi:hypothetical protein